MSTITPMSNYRTFVVEGHRPWNRFHRPINLETDGLPGRFSVLTGPDDAFVYEHLADRTLVKVSDSSLVQVDRYYRSDG